MLAVRLKHLQELAEKLSVRMNAWELLNEALTHRTYTAEHPGQRLRDNQRLEFLGDAVLGMIVADYLFSRFPDKAEGDLTRMRAAVVCEAALARLAFKLDLGKYLLLGKGEDLSGGRYRASTLSDAVEAIIGAVFLDQGLEKTKEMVLAFLKDEIEEVAQRGSRDFKTALQELVHRLYEDVVTYDVIQETGPDHNKRYEMGVIIKGILVATGKGRSKKEAEQQAAEKALNKLKAKYKLEI
ncbi:MAG TPA: ribonuclease III [Clostridia bacterium]|nr:ribonuclease III [Clostridia bacterium]